VLCTGAAEEIDATGAASTAEADATDAAAVSAGKLVDGIAGGAGTGAAAGNSTTPLVLDFTWATGFVIPSKRGVTGAGGFAVTVVAAGCTSSCEPMETNGSTGFGAALIGDVTAGGVTTGENDSGSTGFCTTGSGAGAGAQEISDAGATGAFLIGVGVSTTVGGAGLFAGADPSEGK
jgi:hypothetical protein